MKKLILFLFTATILFVALPVVLVAGESPGTPTVENPINLGMFADIAALAAGIAAITLFVKTTFSTSGLVTDIISWALGPILGLIGWYFNLGMFAEMLWYIAILYGLLAAFSANKGYDLLSVLIGKKDKNYKKPS